MQNYPKSEMPRFQRFTSGLGSIQSAIGVMTRTVCIGTISPSMGRPLQVGTLPEELEDDASECSRVHTRMYQAH